MAEFFAMGGYAFHVWTSWGVSTILLVGLAFARQRHLRKVAAIAREQGLQAEAENITP